MTEEQKRQVKFLAGLAVALAVILYFQIGKLMRIKEENRLTTPEAYEEYVSQQESWMRVGPGPGDVVKVTGLRIFDKSMSIVTVHEVEDPERKHLVWVYPHSQAAVLVPLDFLPDEIVNAGAPLYRGLSRSSGAIEWEDEEGRTIRGLPDGFGGCFDVTESDLETHLFHRYNPVRDSQLALKSPRMATPEAAHQQEIAGATWVPYLEPEDRVLGLASGDEAKAYPVKMLNYHEIVNDTLGGEDVMLVYSALSGSGMAYRPRVGDGTDAFGFSGFLFNSMPLLYDSKTFSLWTHFDGEAISGPARGERLETVPVVQTTWGRWLELYPDTLVVSASTGYRIPYGIDPYRQDFRHNYFATERLVARVLLSDGTYERAIAPIDDRFSNKAWTIGVFGEDGAWGYPIAELAKGDENPLIAEVGGRSVKIHFDADPETGYATDEEGNPLPDAVLTLWFAWKVTYPETKVYTREIETSDSP